VPAERIEPATLATLVEQVRAAAVQMSQRLSHLSERAAWPALRNKKVA
jgi:hypothetical protein